MIILTIVFGLISIVGVVGTIYFGIEARRLSREKIRFSWDELQVGSRDLATRVQGSGFDPEVILSLSVRGATIAGIIATEFGLDLPLFLCVQEEAESSSFNPSGHTPIKTGKWRIFIPDTLADHSDKRILIVDDFVMSGDSLGACRSHLESIGFRSIRSATLVCTETAIDGGKAPDFYWFECPSSRFYFPWGRAR